MNHYHVETLTLPHGYTAEIEIDCDAENPFSEWDGEPPIAVFNGGRNGRSRLEHYKGDELTLPALLELIPDDRWESRDGKRAIAAAVEPLAPMAEIADAMRYHGLTFRQAVEDCAHDSPESWSAAVDYFDAMEAIANLAGVPCHLTQSNGSCQGDFALVMTAALPAWVEKVGAPADSLKSQCESACELWGNWAWGRVYGVASISRPDGEEIADGSCWGFYGYEWDGNGLLDHCRGAVKQDRRERAAEHWSARREAREAAAMACRDIMTA